MYPVLNWTELETYVDLIRPFIVNQRIQRISIPARPIFDAGFLKREWMLELSNRSALVLSLRSGQCSIAWYAEGQISRFSKATHSTFDLGLKKEIEGTTIEGIETVPGERWCRIRLKRKDLFVALIPSALDAVLVETENSKAILSLREKEWSVPLPRKQDHKMPERSDLFSKPGDFASAIEDFLVKHALDERKQRMIRAIDAEEKKLSTRTEATKRELIAVQAEPHYAVWGELLRANLYLNLLPQNENKKSFYSVQSYENNEFLKIPYRAEWANPQTHMEQYFRLSKRLVRKKLDLENRIAWAKERLSELAHKKSEIGNIFDPVLLREIETKTRSRDQSDQKKSGGIKHFTSRDGFSVLVGRSKAENLELTLRVARGNDLWFHVRGRPGAHVVLQIPAKKNAPLQTLLYAAKLALYFSGGKGWGKTEVDYTFRKNVKRISGSDEVQYSNNKTLVVEIDPEFLSSIQT